VAEEDENGTIPQDSTACFPWYSIGASFEARRLGWPAMNEAQKSPVISGDPSRRASAVSMVVLLSAIASAATVILYHEALGLPFFFDDMIHLRWLDWHSLSSIWTTAEGLGYYRPLTMSVWKIDHMLFGGNDPSRLHGLNLFLHALNAGLAGCIAWQAYRGRGRMLLAAVTTLIYVSYPFSYQAVPSTSSLSKPLSTALVLGSVALYLQARRSRSGWLVALSLLLGFLAPFAYEVGVMVPLAILAAEVLAYSRKGVDRFSRIPILFMVLIWAVALPLVVLLEPQTGASLRMPAVVDLWQNGTFFAQGLIFPVSPVATILERRLPLDRYVLLGVVDLIGFVLLFAFYRWVRRVSLFLYGLSWFLIGVLPHWLQLDFKYVITSPRILYLGGVGSALLWAGIPVFLWIRAPMRLWARSLAVCILLGMMLFNYRYVRDKMSLAEAIADPLAQATEAAASAAGKEADPRGESVSLLYVNVPAWIAPREPTYRVGTEGLTFIPEYVRVQDFVYVNSGAEPSITAAAFDATKKEWDAHIGYAGDRLDSDTLEQLIRRVDAVYMTFYSADRLRFVEAGALDEHALAPAGDADSIRFGDDFSLTDYSVELSDSELVLRSVWYCRRAPEEDVTLFAHVYDGNGQLIGQADGYPVLGLFPARSCGSGEQIRDIRYIALPDAQADQAYRVAVGWYSTATGQRFAAFDQEGQPVADNAFEVFRSDPDD
jgi:hypothetical protein